MILNPKENKYEYLDEKSRSIMLKTIEFFENKGKEKLKTDYHAKVWYADFIEFLKKEKIFATLLTPSAYGGEGCRWDTYRNCAFNEILGFYGLPYWYTWQVTILGLGPIWMGNNEAVKVKTAKLLEDGGIFAFGLSEKGHGADLYSSEMALTPLGDGNTSPMAVNTTSAMPTRLLWCRPSARTRKPMNMYFSWWIPSTTTTT